MIDNRVERIWGDAVLLQQVLINLVKNALEARSENDEPCVWLTLTSQRRRDEENVLIEIIDNGQGIANIDNLFVPFYTTKKQGQGIGLGFSKNIIEQHGGRLTLVNNDNKPGATAKILLLQKQG